jgi:hypothetical protein
METINANKAKEITNAAIKAKKSKIEQDAKYELEFIVGSEKTPSPCGWGNSLKIEKNVNTEKQEKVQDGITGITETL